MRKRGRYLVGIAIGVTVVAVLAVALNRSREPVYEGKSLSEWVLWRAYNGPPENYSWPRAPDHIGTNALPYLVKWIHYESPPWKKKLYRAISKILTRVNASWELSDRREIKAIGAAFVMTDLDRGAEAAIPNLSRLANDPRSRQSRLRAAWVLRGFGKAGLPALLGVVTNQQAETRRYMPLFLTAVNYITYMGTNGQPAVPVLLSLLKDADVQLRDQATNALLRIDPEALKRAYAPADQAVQEGEEPLNRR